MGSCGSGQEYPLDEDHRFRMDMQRVGIRVSDPNQKHCSSDMGKDLPDYEEIPVPLEMPEEVYAGYKHAEDTLRRFMKSDRKAARKLLSAYMNLLTVYPDQPYGQPEIVHPINGSVVVMPKSIGDFNSILPKEEKTLEIVRAKVAAGEGVLIYTS